MNLNLAILRDELAPWTFSARYADEVTDLTCTHPLVYRPGAQLEPGPVYLARAEDLPPRIPRHEGSVNIICIGVFAGSLPQPKLNILETQADADLYELLERVLDVFQQYYRWEVDMRSIADENRPMQDFARVSARIVRNPLLFSFSGLRCLFHNADQLRALSKRRFKKYCASYTDTGELLQESELPPLDTINLLAASPDFQGIATATSPTLFKNPTLDYDSLYMNLLIDGAAYGRLVIDGVQHEFTDRDYAVAAIMGEYLDRILKARMATVAPNTEKFNMVLMLMLQHKLVDEEAIATGLEDVGWAMRGRFFTMALEPNSYAKGHTLTAPLAARISQQLPSSHAVAFGDRIAVVVNLGDGVSGKAEYLQRAMPMLRDSLLVVGTSSVYGDFKDVYYYYQQSIRALELGKAADSTNWHFDYQDYLLADLLAHARGKQSVESCLPDGLNRLVAYDESHDSDLVDLLRVYLESCCNIAETSREMFIHRNTCLYRLDRIYAITGTTFADNKTRLSYLMGFAIMDAARG